MVASLVVGGVLVLAMVAASGRAAVTLAADARVPIHFGSPERCFLVSKRAGLIIWPAAGAALSVGRSGRRAVNTATATALAICSALLPGNGLQLQSGRPAARRGPLQA